MCQCPRALLHPIQSSQVRWPSTIIPQLQLVDICYTLTQCKACTLAVNWIVEKSRLFGLILYKRHYCVGLFSRKSQDSLEQNGRLRSTRFCCRHGGLNLLFEVQFACIECLRFRLQVTDPATSSLHMSFAVPQALACPVQNRHLHELEMGRTQSLGTAVVGRIQHMTPIPHCRLSRITTGFWRHPCLRSKSVLQSILW
jgi:hypothetical protein